MTSEDKKKDLEDSNIKNLQREIIGFISQGIRAVLAKVDLNSLRFIEEIRLRANKPLIVQNFYNDWFIDTSGNLTKKHSNLFIVSQEEVIKTLELMSQNSLYAYQDEIRNGFITLRGGHRVGIAGRIVLEGGAVKNIKDISGINIRVSRESLGCAAKILKYITNNKNSVYNTLIISPPQCGKTTMLRDVARIISEGTEELNFKGLKVGIVDERSEIAACYKGIPQNEVGIRTDVLDGCPKSLGMVMMLRSMSPQVILTDEIGNSGDKEAVMQVINAGVKIITTAHGYNISELKTRQEVLNLIESKVFERYIVLSNTDGPGTVEEVIDGFTMKDVI